jgi:ATP-dependent protease ClpP protease subunit
MSLTMGSPVIGNGRQLLLREEELMPAPARLDCSAAACAPEWQTARLPRDLHLAAERLWREDPRIPLAFADLQALVQALVGSRGLSADWLIEETLNRVYSNRQLLRAAEIRRNAWTERADLAPRDAMVQIMSGRVVVWIYGPIGLGGVALHQANDALAGLQEGHAIIVRIDSCGGDLNDALRTACLIRDSKARSLAIIDRCCFSAATVIAAACDRVHMRASALWLTHRSSTLANGDFSALRSAADLCLHNDLRLARFIGRRRGIQTSALLEISDKAEFLSAARAQSHGLIDQVIADLPAKCRSQSPLVESEEAPRIGLSYQHAATPPRSNTMFGKTKSKCESEFNSAMAAMVKSESHVNVLQERLAAERTGIGTMTSQVEAIKRERHAQMAKGDQSEASVLLFDAISDRLRAAESRLKARQEYLAVSCALLIEAKAALHHDERRAAAAQLALASETMGKLEQELAETIKQKLPSLAAATFTWADCQALQNPHSANRPERTLMAVVLKLVDALQLHDAAQWDSGPATSAGPLPCTPIRSAAISEADRNLIIRNYAGSGADVEAFKRILGSPTIVDGIPRATVPVDPIEYHLAQIT